MEDRSATADKLEFLAILYPRSSILWVFKLERSAGIAPAPPRWQRSVLLLNYERMRRGTPSHTPAFLFPQQRTNTFIDSLFQERLDGHGNFTVERFGVLGHTSHEALCEFQI